MGATEINFVGERHFFCALMILDSFLQNIFVFFFLALVATLDGYCTSSD